jgi:hypothetical protein
MNVVRHHAIGMNPKRMLRGHLLQPGDQPSCAVGVAEQRRALVAACSHKVPPAAAIVGRRQTIPRAVSFHREAHPRPPCCGALRLRGGRHPRRPKPNTDKPPRRTRRWRARHEARGLANWASPPLQMRHRPRPRRRIARPRDVVANSGEPAATGHRAPRRAPLATRRRRP